MISSIGKHIWEVCPHCKGESKKWLRGTCPVCFLNPKYYKGGSMTQIAWDCYFLRVAKMISTNSKCLSRKIGAVLVRDNSIISTGYNGPARGVVHCNDRPIDFYLSLDGAQALIPDREEGICPRKAFNYRSGEGLHLCQAGHAERNALIQAGRNGISTKDTVLYLYCEKTSLPCKDCCIEIINAGVKEVVCLEGEYYDKYGKQLLEEANIITRKIDDKIL